MGGGPSCTQYVKGKTYQVTEWDLQPKTIASFKTPQNAAEMREIIQMLQNHQIPKVCDFATQLISTATILNQCPNLDQLEVCENQQLIVIGDIHGYLSGVIKILAYYGLPGEIYNGKQLVYLFNGDFTDRGGSGYQILYLLATLKQFAPHYLHLNRGNHESIDISLDDSPCQMYRFIEELVHKFPAAFLNEKHLNDDTQDNEQCKEKLLTSITNFFTSIPLAHIINEHTLICHGGTPAQFDIHQLDQASPKRYEVKSFESKKGNLPIWREFVWSYDRTEVQAQFLRSNGLKTLICSHTSVPYHYITSYNSDNELKFFVNDEDRWLQFQENKDDFSQYVHIAEIFSSPTNFDNFYVLEWNGHDPRQWKYNMIGECNEVKFVDIHQKK